jgi:hypothetical protein
LKYEKEKMTDHIPAWSAYGDNLIRHGYLALVIYERKTWKTTKVFVTIISIAAMAVILAGGALVFHQQVKEAKNGLWEPVTPLGKG